MSHQSPSRDTSEETFESITPLDLPKTPSIEKIENLPLDPTNVYSKSPSGTLRKLTSPFRRLSSEKIKTSSDDQQTPDKSSDGIVSPRSEVKKKKNTARKKAGAFVRKLSQFRQQQFRKSAVVTSVEAEHPDEQDEGSVHDDSGSQYGSVEDVEMPTTPIQAEDIPPPLTTPIDSPPPLKSADTEQSLPDIVATEHPVSTLPFAISTWKPKKEPLIIKPIETIGPQDSLRKRITAEAAESPDRSSSPTEDERDPPTKAELLSQLVTLAQSQLHSPLGSSETDGKRSRSPSPIPEAPPSPNVKVIEGEQPETPPNSVEDGKAGPSDQAMAPHGDLIQGDPPAAGGAAPPMVTGMVRNSPYEDSERVSSERYSLGLSVVPLFRRRASLVLCGK